MTAGLLALMLVMGQTAQGGHVHEPDEDQCEACADDTLGDTSADSAAALGPDVHRHPAGERNHGTEWFFNQPWATPERWRFLARDSLVLAAAAGGVMLLSGIRRRK